MKVGQRRCKHCGQAQASPRPKAEAAAERSCPGCGAPLDGDALSEFASRLARFGLGDTPLPILNRVPELPDAK